MRNTQRAIAQQDRTIDPQAVGARAGAVGARVVGLARLAAALHMAEAARERLESGIGEQGGPARLREGGAR